MAILILAGAPSYTSLFQARIRRNLSYWQEYVAGHTADPAALDRERERILKAIGFGLEHEPAWPAAYEIIVALAPHMERRGHWESWNLILTRAIQITEQRGQKEQALDLSGLLARLLYRQSRFKESVTAYWRVIRLSQQLDKKYDEARACTNLGYYYVEQGYFYRAEVLCCHALVIFEQLDSQHGLAHTHNHLGALYTWQGIWAQAEHHLKQACTIWQITGDYHGLMRGYANLGFLFNEMNYPYEAISFLRKALKQADQVGEEVIMGVIYRNLGIAYKLKGDLTEAETHCWQAETIFRRFSSLYHLADIQENLGSISIDQQNWPTTNLYLQSALDIWRRLGNKPGEVQTMICFIEYELARKNYTQANHWLKQAESLLNQYDPKGRYHKLHKRINKIRRSLTE
jgi:tetratricopeptide (TPR) repeat protein